MKHTATCKRCSLTWSWSAVPEDIDVENFVCFFCESEPAHMIDIEPEMREWLDSDDDKDWQATGDETV